MTPATTVHKATPAASDLGAAFRAGVAADSFAPFGSLVPLHLVNAVLDELKAGETLIAQAVDRRWHTVDVLLATEAVTSWHAIGDALGTTGDQARAAYCAWVIHQWHHKSSAGNWPDEAVQTALAIANDLPLVEVDRS